MWCALQNIHRAVYRVFRTLHHYENTSNILGRDNLGLIYFSFQTGEIYRILRLIKYLIFLYNKAYGLGGILCVPGINNRLAL